MQVDLVDFQSDAVIVLISAGLTSLALFVAWFIGNIFPQLFVRLNFKGYDVTLTGFAVVLIYALAGCAGTWAAMWGHSRFLPWVQINGFIVATIGFGLLGTIDDLFGNREAGGFRGHFKQLLTHRKITTGVIKVFGGGIVGLYAGYSLAIWIFDTHRSLFGGLVSPLTEGVITLILYGVFIALSANTANLLDLRPGRCVSTAIVVLTMIYVAAVVQGQTIIEELTAMQLGCLLLFYLFDRNGKVMLGDCGSNTIGAALAVCWICVLTRWEIAIAVVLLVAFQIWCEKHSLSRFIESKPILRALDRKIGVR